MTIRKALVATFVSGACALAFSAQPAAAQNGGTFFGHDASGKWMLGVKGANIVNEADGYEDASSYGIVVGYQFSRAVGGSGSASLEFEYMTSDDGDINAGSQFGQVGEWDVDTFAVYMAYRTAGTVFFKGKLGALNSEIESRIAGQVISEDDVGFAFGAGLGVLLGDAGLVEVEYTGVTGDNDISLITLGGSLLF